MKGNLSSISQIEGPPEWRATLVHVTLTVTEIGQIWPVKLSGREHAAPSLLAS